MNKADCLLLESERGERCRKFTVDVLGLAKWTAVTCIHDTLH